MQKFFNLICLSRRQKKRSDTTSMIVAEKQKCIYRKFHTMSIAKDGSKVEFIRQKEQEWIRCRKTEKQPELDQYGEEHIALGYEKHILSQI